MQLNQKEALYLQMSQSPEFKKKKIQNGFTSLLTSPSWSCIWWAYKRGTVIWGHLHLQSDYVPYKGVHTRTKVRAMELGYQSILPDLNYWEKLKRASQQHWESLERGQEFNLSGVGGDACLGGHMTLPIMCPLPTCSLQQESLVRP